MSLFINKRIKHLGYRLMFANMWLWCRQQSEGENMRMKYIKRLIEVISGSPLLLRRLSPPYSLLLQMRSLPHYQRPNRSGTFLQPMSLEGHTITQSSWLSLGFPLGVVRSRGLHKYRGCQKILCSLRKEEDCKAG